MEECDIVPWALNLQSANVFHVLLEGILYLLRIHMHMEPPSV